MRVLREKRLYRFHMGRGLNYLLLCVALLYGCVNVETNDHVEVIINGNVSVEANVR